MDSSMTRRLRPATFRVHCPACGMEANICTCKEQLWTVRDVARYLRLHDKTVYDYVERGTLPCARLGRVVRFRPLDVARWVAARLE